jgi:predicted ATPase
MNLLVKNFAKIGEADIDVNGLTVIAGANGSGKSTVGKLFYCLICAAYKTKTDFEKEKLRRIRNVLDQTESFSLENFFEEVKRSDTGKTAFSILSAGGADEYNLSLNNKAKIKKIMSVSEADFFKACLDKMFKYEFGSQLLNVHNMESSAIKLVINENIRIRINIKSNTEITVEEAQLNDEKLTEAFYIDTPYIMDDTTTFGVYHRKDLKRRLIVETDNVAQKIFNLLLSDAAPSMGDTSGALVHITNEAAGYKTILMLKRLLAKGLLMGGNLLILDEPEIHLHPNLQIILAEILVLLVKSKQINVLLNTHSPYFLEAIEVYSEKHKINDSSKYYLAVEEEKKSVIKDTTENVEEIYALLSMPFRKLEEIRNDLYDTE